MLHLVGGSLKRTKKLKVAMSGEVFDFEAHELESFIERYLELDRRVQRPRNIFSIVRGPREQKYQYTLKYFLDPQKPHGFGYTLLGTFLESVGVHEYNLTGQHIEIDDEVRIADGDSEGRIDLVICGGSALADHPRWAVFIELKVGAEEGTRQTKKYAGTETWSFSWFDSNELEVDRLEERTYLYVKRDTAEDPTESETFEPVAWSDVVSTFEREIQDSIFDYPNRSVIQFTDFIQSLKETEGMDPSFDADELNERLNLYFEHSDLIQQVEQANSQFESDFEDLSDFLRDNWVDRLARKYDFEHSGWEVSTSSNPKYQGILPGYWAQDPLGWSSTIKLYFHHSPTTDHLRKQTLAFRLRLPPARKVHREEFNGGRSFNDVFTERCSTEYVDRIRDSLNSVDDVEFRLGSASTLVEKEYPLDPNNLTGSYFEQLDRAVSEFCSDRSELVEVINQVFEDSYLDVFDEEPEGDFPGYLPGLDD